MRKNFYFLLISSVITIQVSAQCWQKVSPGAFHTIGLKNDATLWGWGNTTSGLIGDGTNTPRLSPVQIGTGNNWSQAFAVGYDHTLAIKTDGTLWAWGINGNGQLGNGNTTSSNTPIQIGTATDWLAVAAGRNFSLALKTNGTLWAWGYNGWGQLGDGTFADKNTPVQIGSAANWVQIDAGETMSSALTSAGTIWTWGRNFYGELGLGNTTNFTTPQQVGTATDWLTISNGAYFMLAKKTNGSIWTWGDNNYGQIGNGTSTNATSPVQVGTATDWNNVIAGDYFAMAIKNNGSRWAWGSNLHGQYGNGTFGVNSNTPLQTGSFTDWQNLFANFSTGTAFGIRSGSNLWAAGFNGNANIGDGTTTNQINFVQISCSSILPVTWLSVNGKLQNNNAIIEWATASESNSSHFEIEHSSNGITYNKVGSKVAAGTSSSTSNYSFTHVSPPVGKNFYRIKQVDLDGKFTYSSIVVLQNSDVKAKVIIAPNPVINTVSLYFSETGNKTIQLISMDGRVLTTQNINGANSTHSINMGHMPAGVYILRLVTGKGTDTYKINKQ
jgi:alpha-tubulin suppressor-like RCC1 family protein